MSLGPHFYGHVGSARIALRRILADLVGLVILRQWSGMFNGIALLPFLAVTAFSLRKGSVESHPTKARSPRPP